MAPDVKDKLAAGRAAKLPWHVRFFTRQSRKGLPASACAVALERGIRIPMPDGTHQIADRYIPQTGGPCPALLVRTPYGRGFPYDFMYGSLFAEHGYNVLLQSTRGTGGSGGSCEPFADEAADGQATIAWLREQPWFSGSLATIGASYLGFTQWALANDVPPELKAMVVQVSTEDFYRFVYPGGAFALEATFTGVAAMLSQDKGLGAFIRAALRLMLTSAAPVASTRIAKRRKIQRRRGTGMPQSGGAPEELTTSSHCLADTIPAKRSRSGCIDMRIGNSLKKRVSEVSQPRRARPEAGLPDLSVRRGQALDVGPLVGSEPGR